MWHPSRAEGVADKPKHLLASDQFTKGTQSPSSISPAWLNTLLCVHLPASNPVISRGTLAEDVATLYRDASSPGTLRAYMLSALIASHRSYPAMPLARQLAH